MLYKTKPMPSAKTAQFPMRPAVALTCPHCWTEQRAERNRCYCCGAEFRFDDEAARQPSEGEEEANKNCTCVPVAL